MTTLIFNDNFLIGNYEKPYIIAEINSSHNGCFETAKTMIDKAKEVGCNCVKFQSWSTETLYSASYYNENPLVKRIVEKFSLTANELYELSKYCLKVGISFSSTPYSTEEVDFLADKCKVPFIKIASMEINNHEFLKYIGNKGIPVVLSTGMAEMDEIKKAVTDLEVTGNHKIVILHCVSIYPAPPLTINLNNIHSFRKEFPKYPIGFSDHTPGIETANAATALGACLIEKHFSLDNKKIGMDNNMAIEPIEMAQLVQGCHNVYEAMGSTKRVVSDAEYKQRKKMRRSVIAAVDIEEGTTLTIDMLGAKRPGEGIPPDKLSTLVGRVVNCSIKKDTMIIESNLVFQK